MDDELGNIKVLVADDEALARKRIVKFLTKNTRPFDILEASSGKESIQVLASERPDIVFLDVKMTDMTGFDVLAATDKEDIPIIIFVTAFDNFAIKAFELRAIDFLLKPYKEERFNEALNRGVEQLKLESRRFFQTNVLELLDYLKLGNQTTISASYLDQLVLKVNKKYYFVKTEEIIYIQSSAYYAEIFTLDGKKHLHRISMKDLSSQLNPKQFHRISRSTIVCVDQVHQLISEGIGDYSVIMKDGKSFRVTKKYKSAFLMTMGVK